MRNLLHDPVESTLGEAGQLVDAQADRLTALRERLERQDLDVPADLVARLERGVDGLAARLDELDGDEVVEAARALAKRSGPWTFLAGGAAIGLVAWGALRRAGADDTSERPVAGEVEAPVAPD
jgi:hypothetical protein